MGWLRRLFSRERLEADLDKELRFHYENQVAEKVRSGISESEARRLTRIEFGGIEQIKEDCRERRGTMGLSHYCRIFASRCACLPSRRASPPLRF